MPGKIIHMTDDEFERRVRAASPRTSDDVSITMDGRRLDSKEAVLAWWAEVAPEVEAEQAARGRVDRAGSD